jgi:hypothetical protein
VQPHHRKRTSATEGRRLPERLRTGLVLLVAAVVAVAAAADALNGGGGHAAPSPRRTHRRAVSATPLPRPPRGVLPGALWYADAACRLHRRDLATGRDSLLTRSGGHCRFWVAPDRRSVAMHRGRPFVPPEDMEILDVSTGRITAPFQRPDLDFAPPAWSPDSQTLVVCDGSRGPPDLRAYHLGSGRITTPAAFACYPGYLGHRLVYRDLASETRVGGRDVADPSTLTRILHRGIYQEPAPAAGGGLIAVPATTITPAGAAPPITIVVLFTPAGRAVGAWDTGEVADSVSLLDRGRIIAISRPAGLVLDDRVTGAVTAAVQRRPIASAAVSPHGDVLALADGRRVVFASLSGRPAFALPIATRWIQWTR